MKILVVGSGGREHALVWKFRQGPCIARVSCSPGNGGIERDADCFPLDQKNPAAAGDLAAELSVDLTVVGPELPLVSGVADEFATRGLKILAPVREAAQLEGSKVFAKRFMESHGIPTASTYGIFDSPVDVYAELCAVDWPLVIKADGLCAGKGVLVTSSPDEATAFVDRVMDGREFGDAGSRVILEEGLAGTELSYIILTDGKDFVPMAPTRDYKRAFDGDEGPNTGGMGAYSSDDILPAALEKQIIDTVVRPTLDGLAKDGIPYRGFLYFGLMLTSEGPKVLEYNCRLGDPETEVIVRRADFDFAQACMAAADGNLKSVTPKWSPRPAVCVVMASGGYPGTPKTGVPIKGLDATDIPDGVVVFHAGTKRVGTEYHTTGGRVLMVSCSGETLAEARKHCYDAVNKISFDGAFYRTDIAAERRRVAAPQ
ncbi:MAG TPA: phosphoribosylamine--glycine ligase [Candidatus Acidoferrum sp.]|nr:phosphoribosylamine--glycine ligase [Candidatus Acidoferrum sp.]